MSASIARRTFASARYAYTNRHLPTQLVCSCQPEFGGPLISPAPSSTVTSTHIEDWTRPRPAKWGAGASFRRILVLIQGILLEVYASIGRADKAIAIVDEELARVERSGARLREPGLYRLRGQAILTRDSSAPGEAEDCVRKAIEIARGQSATWWELRATVVRCIQKQPPLARYRSCLLRCPNSRTWERFLLAETVPIWRVTAARSTRVSHFRRTSLRVVSSSSSTRSSVPLQCCSPILAFHIIR
jgi:hypothetical protein